MAKPSDTPGFHKLLKEWNRRLKEEGFVDIERTKYDKLELDRPGRHHRYKALDQTTRESKEQYFRKLSQYVAATKFESQIEEQILSLYAQGMSQASIYCALGFKGHRCKVYYPLYRWLRKWGLK